MKKLLLCSLLMLVGAFSAAWADTYELVTDASTLAEGDQIIVAGVYNNAYYAMSPSVSSGSSPKIQATSVTCVDDAIELAADQTAVQVFTLATKTGVTGFALKQSNDDKYVISSSSTNTDYGELSKAYFSAITISNKAATIKINSSGRLLRLYNGTDFRAYANTSNGVNISIYRYVQTKTDVTLAWSSSTASGDIAKKDDFKAPTLTVDPDEAASSVAYSSENEEVATVNASTGAVTLVAEGETKIWAKISNNLTYNDAEASYTLTVTDSDVKVSKPTISVNANEVTLSANDGCTIYYTLDGNDPTNESTAYDNTPFDVTKDCTVKAIAYDAEGNASAVTSAAVTYVRVATPTFNPASEYVASGTTVTIETATEGAKIFYFLNDATEAIEYTAPLTITEATTIKAYATADHYGDSEKATQSYQIGSFVTMTSSITPTTLSMSGNSTAEYTYEDTTVGATYTCKVAGAYPSSVTQSGTPYAFSMKNTNGGLVTTVSPGTVSKIDITLWENASAERSVYIYGSNEAYTTYTKDVIEASTKLFTDAFALTKGKVVTVDLTQLENQYKYVAIIPSTSSATQCSRIDITWSVVKEAGTVVVNEPKITNDGNLVTITPNEDDNKDKTVIYYTTDGNDPTAASTKYEAPFTITEGCTVKAIAYVGEVASEVASAEVTFSKVATPIISISSDAVLAGQTVAVSCATANATIYYAFGDNDFAEYTGALTINEATTLKVKATRANYADSEVATADYTIGEAVAYTLVTYADQLTDGGKYLIAHSDDSVILGKYNANNFFPTTAFLKDNTTISVAEGSQSVNVVTLVAKGDKWTLKTGLEEKYIAAGSSSSNNVYLSTDVTENNGEIKSLTFADDGQTSIKFNASDAGVRAYFNYGGTYFSCFAYDRSVKLYKYLKPVELSWSVSKAEATFGEDFTAPTLTVDPEAAASAVQYSSSDTDVADFIDGTLTIKAAGTTTITAAIANDATYQDASASYTLTVSLPSVGEISVSYPEYFNSGKEGENEICVMADTKLTFTSENATTITLSYTDDDKNAVEQTLENDNFVWTVPADFGATVTVTASAEGYQSVSKTYDIYGDSAVDELSTPTYNYVQDTQSCTISADKGVLMIKITADRKANSAPQRVAKYDVQDWTAAENQSFTFSNTDFDFDNDNISSFTVQAKTVTPSAESDVLSLNVEPENVTVAGINGVAADSQDAPVEYYNLQGVRVSNPGTGLYIRRQGTKVEKVAIR